MGPNGTGKSTLVSTIMGHYKYKVTEGEILLDGEDVLKMSVDERSRKGLFLAMQYPSEIEGVTNSDFIKTALHTRMNKDEKFSLIQYIKAFEKATEELKMRSDLPHRYVNVGFSGGEKKKNEILQMLTLNPKLAILDETDSGLDVDAIKTVSKGIKMYSNENNGVLIITHGTKILQGLHVDYVHVLVDGKIIKTSTGDLANEIEAKGYEEYKK